MNKLIVYSLLFLLSSSCSRSMYYAYEGEHSYCTIEAIPKRKLWWLLGRRFDQVIYRATSKEHYDTTRIMNEYLNWKERRSKKKDNIYIYIKNSSFFYDIYEEIAVEGSFDFFYIERNNLYRYDFCLALSEDVPNYALYITKKDSLLADYIDYLDEQHCFTQQGIDWFPPYFVRVKKIDYSKFNVPEVKYKYLKNPRHRNAPRYDKKWEDEQKKKANKEERRKEREKEK